jgi:hypothetical protein
MPFRCQGYLYSPNTLQINAVKLVYHQGGEAVVERVTNASYRP